MIGKTISHYVIVDKLGGGGMGVVYKAAEDKAQQLGLTDAIVNNMATEALADAILGDRSAAVSQADAVLKKSQSPNPMIWIADVYARAAEDAKAEKTMSQAAIGRPNDEIMQSVNVPMVQAQLALNRHRAQEAVDLMQKAVANDRANTESLYTRGIALLMAGRSPEAQQEFQRALALRNAQPVDFFVSLSQLGLARAYAAQGNKSEAKTAYQDFLAAFKDADTGLPIVKEVQAEYAKLSQ